MVRRPAASKVPGFGREAGFLPHHRPTESEILAGGSAIPIQQASRVTPVRARVREPLLQHASAELSLENIAMTCENTTN